MNGDKIKPRDPFLQFKDEVFTQYAQRYPEIKGSHLVALLAQDFRKLPNDVVEKYERRFQQQLAEAELQKSQLNARKMTVKATKTGDGINNDLYQINIDCEHKITEISLKIRREGDKEDIPVKIKLDYDEE